MLFINHNVYFKTAFLIDYKTRGFWSRISFSTILLLLLLLSFLLLLFPNIFYRPNVPQMLFVMTDGASNSKPDTIQSAKLLHQNNVTVFAVGIGNAKQDELLAIASDDKLVYTYTDFSMLSKIKDKFSKETCEGNSQSQQSCSDLSS